MIVSFSFGHRLPHLAKMILSQCDIHDWTRLRRGSLKLEAIHRTCDKCPCTHTCAHRRMMYVSTLARQKWLEMLEMRPMRPMKAMLPRSWLSRPRASRRKAFPSLFWPRSSSEIDIGTMYNQQHCCLPVQDWTIFKQYHHP